MHVLHRDSEVEEIVKIAAKRWLMRKKPRRACNANRGQKRRPAKKRRCNRCKARMISARETGRWGLGEVAFPVQTAQPGDQRG